MGKNRISVKKIYQYYKSADQGIQTRIKMFFLLCGLQFSLSISSLWLNNPDVDKIITFLSLIFFLSPGLIFFKKNVHPHLVAQVSGFHFFLLFTSLTILLYRRAPLASSSFIESTYPLALMGLFFYFVFLLISNNRFFRSPDLLALNVLIPVLFFPPFLYISNVVLDASVPEIQTAQVIRKNVSCGRGCSYYAVVFPGFKKNSPTTLSIDKDLSDETPQEGWVRLNRHTGALGVPFFTNMQNTLKITSTQNPPGVKSTAKRTPRQLSFLEALLFIILIPMIALLMVSLFLISKRCSNCENYILIREKKCIYCGSILNKT